MYLCTYVLILLAPSIRATISTINSTIIVLHSRQYALLMIDDSIVLLAIVVLASYNCIIVIVINNNNININDSTINCGTSIVINS